MTTYEVRALKDGCLSTDNVKVTVNPKPVVNISKLDSVCAPNTVDLTQGVAGTNLGTQTYYTDALATTEYLTPETADSGMYYVVSVSDSSCSSDTMQIDARVNPKPELSITQPAALCAPGTVDITKTVGGTNIGTNRYYSTSLALVATNPQTADSGTYFVITETDLGCTDTAQINVVVNPKPELQITDPTALCGDTAQDLTLSSITAGSMNLGGNFTYYTDAALTNPVADPTKVGTGTYYIMDETAAGCKDTSVINVTVNAPEIEVQGNEQVIPNGQVVTSEKDSTEFGDVHITSQSTSVTYFIINKGGCELLLDSLVSSDDNFAIISVSDSTINAGDTSFVTITFDPDVVGDDNATITIYNSDVTYTYNVSGTGTGDPDISVFGNDVEIMDGQTETSDKDSTDFGTIVDVLTGFNTNTFVIHNDGVDTLFIINITSDDDAFTVTQVLSDTLLPGESTSFTVTFDPDEVSEQTAIITIVNTDPDEDPFTFTVIGDVQLPDVIIYEGFSPDDNGKNDDWVIDNIQYYPDNHVEIYNRWGNLVWEGDGYDNETVVWDGQANQGLVVGESLPDGTYFYVVDYINNCDEPTSEQGYVMIATNK